jgi:hypothetical protein
VYWKYSEDRKVNLSGTGDTRTFQMPPQDVIVFARFELIPYDINILAAANGSIEALDENGDSVTQAGIGSVITLQIDPDDDYVLKTLSVTRQDTGAAITVYSTDETTYSFTMPGSDVNITATFEEVSAGDKVISIFFEGFGSEKIILDGDTGGTVYQGSILSIEITNYEDYDDVAWYVGGEVDVNFQGYNYFSHQIYNNILPGIYTITAAVRVTNQDTGIDDYYSKVLEYTVIEFKGGGPL